MNAKLEAILDTMRSMKWDTGIEMIKYMQCQGLSNDEMIAVAQQMRQEDRVGKILKGIDEGT